MGVSHLLDKPSPEPVKGRGGDGFDGWVLSLPRGSTSTSWRFKQMKRTPIRRPCLWLIRDKCAYKNNDENSDDDPIHDLLR